MKSEIDYLIDQLNATRILTKFYLRYLKDVDKTKSFSYDNVEFNSVYWVVGHIAWAENSLLLSGTGGKRVKLPWLKPFGIGKTFEYSEDMPSYEELLEGMEQIHQAAIEHLRTLTPENLEEDNPLDFVFAKEKSKRMMIQHAARHEAAHAGHLSWLCKMHGVKTF